MIDRERKQRDLLWFGFYAERADGSWVDATTVQWDREGRFLYVEDGLGKGFVWTCEVLP